MTLELNFKQNEVLNNLKRIGGVEFENINKIIACDETFFYRNKMEFTFSNKRWLTDEEIKNCKIIKDKNACGFHISEDTIRLLILKNVIYKKNLQTQ